MSPTVGSEWDIPIRSTGAVTVVEHDGDKHYRHSMKIIVQHVIQRYRAFPLVALQNSAQGIGRPPLFREHEEALLKQTRYRAVALGQGTEWGKEGEAETPPVFSVGLGKHFAPTYPSLEAECSAPNLDLRRVYTPKRRGIG